MAQGKWHRKGIQSEHQCVGASAVYVDADKTGSRCKSDIYAASDEVEEEALTITHVVYSPDFLYHYPPLENP